MRSKELHAAWSSFCVYPTLPSLGQRQAVQMLRRSQNCSFSVVLLDSVIKCRCHSGAFIDISALREKLFYLFDIARSCGVL